MLREMPSSPPIPSPLAWSSTSTGTMGWGGLGSQPLRLRRPSTSTSVSSSLLEQRCSSQTGGREGDRAVRQAEVSCERQRKKRKAQEGPALAKEKAHEHCPLRPRYELTGPVQSSTNIYKPSSHFYPKIPLLPVCLTSRFYTGCYHPPGSPLHSLATMLFWLFPVLFPHNLSPTSPTSPLRPSQCPRIASLTMSPPQGDIQHTTFQIHLS